MRPPPQHTLHPPTCDADVPHQHRLGDLGPHGESCGPPVQHVVAAAQLHLEKGWGVLGGEVGGSGVGWSHCWGGGSHPRVGGRGTNLSAITHHLFCILTEHPLPQGGTQGTLGTAPRDTPPKPPPAPQTHTVKLPALLRRPHPTRLLHRGLALVILHLQRWCEDGDPPHVPRDPPMSPGTPTLQPGLHPSSPQHLRRTQRRCCCRGRCTQRRPCLTA